MCPLALKTVTSLSMKAPTGTIVRSGDMERFSRTSFLVVRRGPECENALTCLTIHLGQFRHRTENRYEDAGDSYTFHDRSSRIAEPPRGHRGAHNHKATIVGFGHHRTALYAGCPICTKSLRSSERCSHSFISPKNFYRMRIFLEDETGALETTAWESARFITGMSLEDFEVVHLRGDQNDILNRCIGRQWMFQLTRIQSNRGPYARVEHAEAVSKKELIPNPEGGVGVMNEAIGLRHRVFSPEKQVSAFGLGEVLSLRTVESHDIVVGRSKTEQPILQNSEVESRDTIPRGRQEHLEFMWVLFGATFRSGVFVMMGFRASHLFLLSLAFFV
ncbi:hypothetical protein R1sor_022292 [Riccia sorocarpa]|uniref:Uncharacterized protein n=1 Tax=Riccia sorocarpa TaxID=122646 RepID=A0ABD3GL61_9MARC